MHQIKLSGPQVISQGFCKLLLEHTSRDVKLCAKTSQNKSGIKKQNKINLLRGEAKAALIFTNLLVLKYKNYQKKISRIKFNYNKIHIF